MYWMYKYVMSKSKLWGPLGCLVGKYKPFGKKIAFQHEKNTLEPFRAIFENTMGNPFLTLSNIGQNALNFLFRIVIIQYFMRKMLSESIFRMYFQIWRRRVQGFFFQARKLIFLPTGLYLPTKEPWGCPMFGFCHHHLKFPLPLQRK